MTTAAAAAADDELTVIVAVDVDVDGAVGGGFEPSLPRGG
jgi:hypothetical protein